MNKTKTYDNAIDLLRLVSILAVVVIHTTTQELHATNYDLNHQTLTFFLNQAARFAVPLFFLISGFVLELNYLPNNILKYYKKRIGRIFIPFVFWSAIYYFFIYTIHSESFLRALVTGDASYQLYFISSLLIFYLIFPVIHNLSKLILRGFVGKLILIFLGVIQLIVLNYTYQHFSFPLPYPVAVVIFNFFVFILGTVLAHSRVKIRQKLKYFWPIFLLGAIASAYFIFKEGFNNYYKTWNFEAFYSQWRPSILIYTVFVFGFLYYLARKVDKSFVKKISELSFFIFFVHIIVLEFVWRYLRPGNSILFSVIVVLISGLLGYAAHKVKFASKITG